jgi:regulator of sigma E protease
MEFLKFIVICLEVIVLFNLLIIVHELGHFLAARWRGLVVERFGIWFGKPLWKKKINGVVYCLGCIPAGGYVALPQMATMETIEGKSEEKQPEYPPISALDKILVALAGPLFSFGLALVFACVVWFVGRPVSESETTTVIGYVVKGSPAEEAGLKPGDKILSVDSLPVNRFGGIGDSVTWRIVRSEGETIPITVERDGQIIQVRAKPVKEKTAAWERASLRQIKIAPKQTPMIARITPHSPADRAGLKPNDIILEIDGQKIFHPETVPDVVKAHAGQKMAFKIQRKADVFTVVLKPEMPEGLATNPTVSEAEKFPRIGVEWDLLGTLDLVHPNPLEQIQASVTSMISTLSGVISRKSDIKLQHLSGPLGIMRIYYLLFQSEQGWRLGIWFSVVLNVNLALLNLLPIPVLDGGHITLALVEGIRRRPVNVRVVNIVQTVCALVIITFMLYVTFFDIQDLKRRRQKPPPDIKFSPRTEPAPAKP